MARKRIEKNDVAKLGWSAVGLVVFIAIVSWVAAKIIFQENERRVSAGLVRYAGVVPPRPPSTEVYAEDYGSKMIRLPGDNKGISFYLYRTMGGIEIRFYRVRIAGNAALVCLDACVECFGAGMGHVRVGKNMVCRKCARMIPIDRLGRYMGECKPFIVPHAIQRDDIVVSVSDLERLNDELFLGSKGGG